MSRPALTHVLLCLGVFVASLLFVSSLAGDCLNAPLDEGIYLEGGERLLEGQVPYRDYFAFTGPMIYWMQAGLQYAFGREMPLLRLSATLSLALMALVIFAVTARLTDWGYGLGAAFVGLSYFAASTYMIIANHRWLSAAFACLAIWAAFEAVGRVKPAALWIAAGLAAAAAAWTTPSFLLLVAAISLWLLVTDRRQLLPLSIGILLISAPATLWLALNGALLPMIDSLLWVGSRYGRANQVPYGYFPSGWDFEQWGNPSLPIVARLLSALGRARYAIAPVAAPLIFATYAWYAWRQKLERPQQLLVIGAAATFLTCYPRWDVNQMLFTMAPMIILIAALAYRLPKLIQPLFVSAAVMWAMFNYSSGLRIASDDLYLPTRAGTQRASPGMTQAYEKLEALIPDRATLFTYPYLPSLGFALHTRNPIRYSFIQPGMMSKQDEAQALSDLEKHAPRFLLRQTFPPNQILIQWPNADPSTLVLSSIERFIDSRYRFLERVNGPHFEVQVMELNP